MSAIAGLQQGLALLGASRHAEAIAAFGQVLRAAPGLVDAHYNRGVSLMALARYAEALRAFETAVSLAPHHPAADHNRLAMLLELGRYESAREGLLSRIATSGENADLLMNLGLAEQSLGRVDEARARFQSALALDPAHRLVRWNLALLDLRARRYAEGFENYDAAWPGAFDRNVHVRDKGRPAWRGEPLEGRSILLHAAEGIGDAIQGLRFVAPVAKRAGRVVLEVQRGLGPLARSAAHGIEVFEIGEALPATDFHSPLHALPARLHSDAQSIRVPGAYLHVDDVLAGAWRQRLGSDARKRVGLAWRGNPTHPDDRHRSVALAALRPLFGIEGVRLVSLQLGAPDADDAAFALPGAPDRIGETTTGFHDTAALVAALDLVITVDTSLAHLSASLGRPTWILLGAKPDWRWLTAGEDTAWYPAARLFRSGGDWDGLASRIHGELQRFVTLG